MIKVGNTIRVNDKCPSINLRGMHGKVLKIEPIPARNDGVRRILCEFDAGTSQTLCWLLEDGLDLVTPHTFSHLLTGTEIASLIKGFSSPKNNCSTYYPPQKTKPKDVDEHLRKQMNDNLRGVFT